MSTTVDNRVVEMRFDNKQFENNVRTSISTLDKLKQSLNLSGASKGLENVSAAAKNNNIGVLGSAVETVQAKFSALQVIGVTALANITNAAINAGTQLVKSLTFEPIMDGFREYETQMNSVQTILANTQSKGTTLKQVTSALDELNHYADLTIYNFTEMTRNIGTFTAAGIDLDTSVSAIQGIANLAAISGSTSQQASTAMYQLSQALAAGTVKLMDWNSVVNAGMGGEVFQNALKKTSEELGTGAEAAIKAEGSFRESLQTGWLTSEVLTETLKKFTTSGANEYVAEYTGLSVDAIQAALDSAEAQYGEADAIDKASEALAEKSGKNKDEIKEALQLAKTAQDAATKVKTFSQLMDTLKEAVGSGWAKTWQIIFGDFEEAKELFTSISDVASELINNMSDARNSMLQEWKDLGGRTALIDGFRAGLEGISSVVGTIRDAFKEVFPPITGEMLFNFTEGFKHLMEVLKPSAETLDKIKRVAKGVFSVFNLVQKSIMALTSPLKELFSGGWIGSVADFLLEIAASIGDFFTAINEGAGTGKFFSSITDGLGSAFKGISDFMSSIIGSVHNFGDVFSAIGDTISNVAGKIGEVLSNVFGWIKENISIGDVFAGLAGGGIFLAAKKIAGAFDTIKDAMSGGILGFILGKKKEDDVVDIKKNICDVLDSVRESLAAFTSGIKAATLVSIAIAIGILAASLNTISKIDPGNIAKSLGAIGAMMIMLNLSFKSIVKSLSMFDSKGIVKAGFSLILMAAAINIFASALKKIADLSFQDIAKGLFALGVGLVELTGALKIIDKSKISLKTSVAIIALAEACKILADALTKFSGMSWDEIGRGLSAMGGALGELVIAIAALNKFGGGRSIFGSIGILIAVQALDKISENLERLGKLSWGEIGRGLSAMGGALGELTIALGALSKIGGFGAVLGGGAIFIVSRALGEIAETLKSIGSMSWDEIEKGLAGLGGALTELAIAVGALGKLAGFSGIFGSGAILLVVQSLPTIVETLKSIGSMSWDEIEKGLAGLGGALSELAIITGTLGKLTGLGGLLGAGALVLAVQSLGKLADEFKKFGGMTWDEIKRSLVGMGGALTEVGVITGALGKLTGLGGLLGAGALVLAVQGLGDLADAFKKFVGMTWDEIKQGLVGMGGALTEVGVITALLGNVGGLGALLGSGSLLIAIQGLGDLADAFKKFGDMDWEKVKTGLVAMGGALGETALGGLLNTFAVIGALSISMVAESLGVLADSVKKWEGVSVPEGLGLQLGALALGIQAFTFSGWGADSIATVAAPLGTLADSVRNWSSVAVPEGLGTQLSALATGVSSFNFSGWGADAIAAVAAPLGTLADSVRNWSSVAIPEGLESTLTGLAKGVKAFSFAFMGGWSLSAVVGPLGELAEAAKKWNGVSIPDGLETGLQGLAKGVQAFSFAFMGGWSLSAVVGPLGELAEAVKKWNGVSIPDGIADKLESLAKGVQAWSFAFIGGWSVSTVVGPLGELADAVKKWNGVELQYGIGENLKSLASGVEDFTGMNVENLSEVCNGVRMIGDAAKDIMGVDFGGLASKLTSFATAISSINVSTDTFANLGSNIVSGFVSAINEGVGQVQSAVTSLADTAVNSFVSAVSAASGRSSTAGIMIVAGLSSGISSGAGNVTGSVNAVMSSALGVVNSNTGAFIGGGITLSSGVASGISSGQGATNSAVSSLVSGAASILRSYFGSFSEAGSFVASGFTSGLRSAISSVAATAASMASSALNAAKNALGIQSPSREFMKIGAYVPQGFAIGIGEFGTQIKKSVTDMSSTALDGTREAISRMSDLFNTDLDVQPTIRPVVDMSDVKASATAINSMLNNDLSIGMRMNLNAISASMRRRNQNGANTEILSAINKLHNDLSNIEQPSYYINGITYDDGSAVASAVETLVRAAVIERRM